VITSRPARRGAKKPGKRTTAARTRTRTRTSAARPRPRRDEPQRPAREEAPGPEAKLAPAPVLSPRELRELRARAHALNPLVQVGHGGVSAAVLSAVSRALHDHELIKVRLHEPEDKHGMAEEIATGTHAALCGLVGHTLILYRPKPRPKARKYSTRARE
jgi:RNA-binding protein